MRVMGPILMQRNCSDDTEIGNVTTGTAQGTGTETMKLIALIEGIDLATGEGLEIVMP